MPLPSEWMILLLQTYPHAAIFLRLISLTRVVHHVPLVDYSHYRYIEVQDIWLTFWSSPFRDIEWPLRPEKYYGYISLWFLKFWVVKCFVLHIWQHNPCIPVALSRGMIRLLQMCYATCNIWNIYERTQETCWPYKLSIFANISYKIWAAQFN